MSLSIFLINYISNGQNLQNSLNNLLSNQGFLYGYLDTTKIIGNTFTPITTNWIGSDYQNEINSVKIDASNGIYIKENCSLLIILIIQVLNNANEVNTNIQLSYGFLVSTNTGSDYTYLMKTVSSNHHDVLIYERSFYCSPGSKFTPVLRSDTSGKNIKIQYAALYAIAIDSSNNPNK